MKLETERIREGVDARIGTTNTRSDDFRIRITVDRVEEVTGDGCVAVERIVHVELQLPSHRLAGEFQFLRVIPEQIHEGRIRGVERIIVIRSAIGLTEVVGLHF